MIYRKWRIDSSMMMAISNELYRTRMQEHIQIAISCMFERLAHLGHKL